MKMNSWFKLAAVSLVAMVISFIILWGYQQYNLSRYYNNNMNGMQMNGYGNMQGNSGYMPGMNMQGNNGYMPGMNMQGGWNMQGNSGYMPGMNMQGNMGNMPGSNMNGNMNMQSGMGM